MGAGQRTGIGASAIFGRRVSPYPALNQGGLVGSSPVIGNVVGKIATKKPATVGTGAGTASSGEIVAKEAVHHLGIVGAAAPLRSRIAYDLAVRHDSARNTATISCLSIADHAIGDDRVRGLRIDAATLILSSVCQRRAIFQRKTLESSGREEGASDCACFSVPVDALNHRNRCTVDAAYGDVVGDADTAIAVDGMADPGVVDAVRDEHDIAVHGLVDRRLDGLASRFPTRAQIRIATV